MRTGPCCFHSSALYRCSLFKPQFSDGLLACVLKGWARRPLSSGNRACKTLVCSTKWVCDADQTRSAHVRAWMATVSARARLKHGVLECDAEGCSCEGRYHSCTRRSVVGLQQSPESRNRHSGFAL